jgi:hypothetical protein
VNQNSNKEIVEIEENKEIQKEEEKKKDEVD